MRPIACVALVLILTGCGDSRSEGGAVARRAEGVSGDSLWVEIATSGFPENWYSWPGREQVRRSRPPHGPSITTYMEFLAYDGLSNGAVTMIDGAVLIIENRDDAGIASLDVMKKTGGAWTFASYTDEGIKLPPGRYEQGCSSCHELSQTDYILTAPLGTAEALGN